MFISKKSFFIFITLILSVLISSFVINFGLFLISYQKNFNDKLFIRNEIDKHNNQEIFINFSRNDFNNSNLETYIFSGIPNIKTIYCEESNNKAIYLSDRYGFRNIDKFWDLQDVDMLIMGDSFGNGACVKDEHTINYQLNYEGFKGINLSYSNNSPLDSLGSLREYGGIINYQFVVYLYYPYNDLAGFEVGLKNPKLNKYFYDKDFSQNLISKSAEITNQLKNIFPKKIQLFSINELKNLFSFYYLRFYLNNINQKKIESKYNYKNILQMFQKQKILSDKKFIFVYLPSFYEIKYNYYLENYDLDFFKNNNIKFIDIKKIFKNESNDPLNYFVNKKFNHYTPEGYNLITKEIIKSLKNIQK